MRIRKEIIRKKLFIIKKIHNEKKKGPKSLWRLCPIAGGHWLESDMFRTGQLSPVKGHVRTIMPWSVRGHISMNSSKQINKSERYSSL